MAKILDMPKLSPTMEEGVLATWHIKEGDAVEVDDLLAEVETDKATMEFRAFDKGTILKLLVAAGANVKLGQPVAILGKPGEDISGLDAGTGPTAAPASAKAPDAAPDAEAKAPEGTQEKQAEKQPAKTTPKAEEGDAEDVEERGAQTPHSPRVAPPPAPEPTKAQAPERPKAPAERGSLLTRTERDDGGRSAAPNGDERAIASPYVRKVARERGIDLSTARGSGEHGRIMPADLDALARDGAAPQPKATSLARTTPAALAVPGLAAPEVRPLSPMRKTIARRLTQSKQTVPHFYLTIDVDAGALSELRERINKELAAGSAAKGAPSESAPKPDKISLNDLLIKACGAALVRVPECNAQFTEEAILIHKRVDISVAVAIPDGLVTPVVRNVDQKSVVAIAREVRDLASRARSKKLKPEEMSDGTFSISNLGMFGIDEFSAVINPPEGAILAVGAVRDEPIVKDGQVVAGKKLALTLSCDHRVVDGAVGAAFLAELRDLIEHPMRVLTG